MTQDLKEGTVVIKEEMRSGEYFGEIALLNRGKRKANVISVGGVDCFVLQRRDFMQSLGSHSQVRNELKRVGTAREMEMKTRRKSAKTKRIKEVSLDELEKVCDLGAGSYGAVTLVKNGKTGDYFALKALHKQLIMDKRQQQSIFRERESWMEARKLCVGVVER